MVVQEGVQPSMLLTIMAIQGSVVLMPFDGQARAL